MQQSTGLMPIGRGGFIRLHPAAIASMALMALLGSLVPIQGAAATPESMPLPPSQSGASLAVATAAQGQTIVVNGRTVAVPWMSTAGAVGLADYGVTDALGATLTNNAQPSRQPVRWFGGPNDTVDLSAWVENGYRYLDILPLAQRHGWDLQTQGSTLRIATPPAAIVALGREDLPGGDRLIVDLSAPAPLHLAEGGSGMVFTLGATATENVLAGAIAAPGGPHLGTLAVQAVPGGTQIQARADHPPRLTTQTLGPQTHRVILEVRPDHLQPHSIAWAPGLRWQQRYVAVEGRPFPVYWLAIDPRQTRLRPIWPDPTTAVGTAPLVTTAQRWQAIAAINAGFFNRNNQFPLGAVRYRDDWVSGPILGRGVVGWTPQGQVRMERLALRQTLTAGAQTFAVQALNSGYVQAGIGAYTTAWGPIYRPILEGEILVTVVDGVVTAQQPASALGGAGLPIPPNGYVLALRSLATAAAALLPGQRVSLESAVLPDTMAPLPHMVGGGPLLIRDRAPVLDAALEQFSPAFATQAAPRSAIGLTADGTILLVAVHHSPQGPGPTLAQLTQILLQLGSASALNLDGGSSASLYLGGRLINRSPRTAARVNSAIGLFLP